MRGGPTGDLYIFLHIRRHPVFERDGTNCENLPETYEFLKKLRAYVDAKYPDRMLLAEANQWPQDAARTLVLQRTVALRNALPAKIRMCCKRGDMRFIHEQPGDDHAYNAPLNFSHPAPRSRVHAYGCNR